jgi:hypothetical protein
LVNGREVAKPATYIIKEIKGIIEEMKEMDIDVDKITYSDL